MKSLRRILSSVLCVCMLMTAVSLFAQPVAAAQYENTPTYSVWNKGVSIGWEGDYNAARTFVDGNFVLRDDQGDSYQIKEQIVTLGISSYGVPASWELAEHYLPCLISEYTQQNFEVKVENFCDCVTIDGNDFVVLYSRQTLTNKAEARELPIPDSMMIPLNDVTAESMVEGAMIGAGETVVREMAIVTDRFQNDYPLPTGEQVAAMGGFDAHYDHMKTYWEDRVSALVQITDVPEGFEDLMYVYKASYIYQMIAKDGIDLNVNETCYDDVYNHDVQSILDNIIQLGDFRYFKEYADHLYYDIASYSDGPYKIAFPYAYYIMKTGDTAPVIADFERITKKISSPFNKQYDTGMTNPDGTKAEIPGQSITVDKRGYWLVDVESGLGGLYAYKYVCDTLYAETGDEQYKTQSEWAMEKYDHLMMSAETCIKTLIDGYGITYLPISMLASNPLSNRGTNTRDGNAFSFFQSGFWTWDGYQMGIDQEDSLLYQMIDDTYTYHFAMRDAMYQSPSFYGYGDGMYSAGGFSDPSFCASFNAGYGSGTLRGTLYRDWTIRATMWMINYAQIAPYTWCESSYWPDADENSYKNFAWSNPESFVYEGTGGDDGHLWGHSLMTQMIIGSFITERIDGHLIIGTGLPYSWMTSGETIAIENYPYAKGNRAGYQLTMTDDKTVQLEISASAPIDCVLALPALINNIASAKDASGNALTFDFAAGTVAIPAGTTSVTVTMKDTAAVRETERDLTVEIEQKLISYQDVTEDAYTVTSYHALTEAMAEAQATVDQKTATAEKLSAALQKMDDAKTNLQLLSDGVVMDNSVLTKDSFFVCFPGDMTYQTFTTGTEAGKVAFVDIWGEIKMNNAYEFEGLKCSIYSLNPTKYYPYKLGDELSSCVLEQGEGTPFRYHFTFDNLVLEPETKYAIVLSVDVDLSEYTEDLETLSPFVWEMGQTTAKEYFINRTSNGKMEENTHVGNGSYRIGFGDGESKAVLNNAAAEAVAVDLTGYSDASVKAFQTAYAELDTLLRAGNATTEQQEAAAAKMAAAITGLEKAPDTEKPVDTTPTTDKPADKSEKTSVPVWVWIVIAAAVVVIVVIAIVAASKKKKQA